MYKVTLSACGNIDIGEDPYDNIVRGIIVRPNVVECDTIEECQHTVRNYIEKNYLGGSNWTGGKVYRNDVQVGYISYNGRYWPKGSKYYWGD